MIRWFVVPAEYKSRLVALPLVAVALWGTWFLGRNPSVAYVAAPLAVVALIAILHQLRLGLLALIVVALLLPRPIGTGTEVAIYPIVLLVPALCVVWLVVAMLRRQLTFPASSIHLPLVLYLAAGLLSLAVGQLTWDPLVPRKDNFVLVQLAQWALFAFSACALWLTAALADGEAWLRRMVIVFLVLGGVLAMLRIVPSAQPLFAELSSGAVDRAPFWLLLVALAGGQLFFHHKLHPLLRLVLVGLIAMACYFAFFLERQAAAYWVGIAVACGVLVWLRFPQLRVPIVLVVVALLATGVVSRALWDFAGGDSEWTESGASRLVLIERVVEVTMRNPVTGLGPAAYRPYANMKPLPYQGAFWLAPQINSHNNYVDFFAHGGILGLALFLWFMAAIARLAWRLHRKHRRGFLAGYINSMLATLAGITVIMFLLDWFMPSVYNAGFYGFQASVLIWLFFGGLVAIEQWGSFAMAEAAPDGSRLYERRASQSGVVGRVGIYHAAHKARSHHLNH